MLNRIIPLILGLILGLAVGLLYGWVIRPVETSEMTARSLRQDYRVELILTIAEAYSMDKDLELARGRLAILESDGRIDEDLSQALNYAKEHEYSDLDIEHLTQLLNGLRSDSTSGESGLP
jgi:hypothetical protein